ncbi:hypothetical protein VOLCADRAFT_96321 [Volvox carteri f. nagariensis]|uniref:cGMP-dependent protein kinase n=1 Tax=Volvox carteri f. nagariensis TaxID=3068 RepID=D8U9T2_VOLCA|nr:uncharacterized protein VOLCADRAFT_96321 [Volvox carteri f. nagariensis]EFJ43467.1 hypothetical protein VOLCADRAFT_96321 [Volvox carteri f. nagariensis]|eukprot:XP_002955396.1 hypothetical protein VOLCADRAFT_96321 [Volvox carteri f. nagariensis]
MRVAPGLRRLKFLKAARKRALEGGAQTGAIDEGGSPHKHTKRRSMQHERKERTSIEQWHEARKSRTSIDICAAFNVTTTDRLSVCKAGITLLINRTYIVIKHLGSGSSGQVKLAFNLRSKKLVAIKAVRKGSGGGSGGGGHGLLSARDARSQDGRSGHRSLSGGGAGGLSASRSVGMLASGPAGTSGGGGGSGRVWRSITPSSFLLRRSASSGLGSSTAAASSCHGSSPPTSSPSPPPLRRCLGGPAHASGPYPAEDFVREIAILKRLSHPNIVQLVEVIDDPASDCLLLVMGYVEGSTLQPQQLQPGRWRQVPEEMVWRYARDVLCGLEYLHCHGVVHGDLKPANFIQDSLTGVVRILDFGSAVLHGRVGGEDGLRGAHVPMSCTPGFRSPESLAAGYRPSFELDMWALGVCLYLWAFGELPFKGSAPFVVYENIRSAPLVIPTHTRISSQLNDLMTRLLDKDPLTRMTVHEAVLHPWTTAQGLAPIRTPSPLVMATRVQMAVAANAAATTAAPAAESGVGTPALRGPLQANCRQFVGAAAAGSGGAGGSNALFPGCTMPRIAEGGSTGNTGSLGHSVTATAAAAALVGGGSTGGRRNSSEAWELRRGVTDAELQAAISSCYDPTGSAAVLMESIFSEVTFPAKHQIIRAGDPLDRIYLITAGEVEIYHDLVLDGPDAPCPHKPIIEGLSDPESELDDPGDFLNIRLPGITVPQLERLSTGLLNMTSGGDRSNHGASHAAAALAAAFGPGPSAPASTGSCMPAAAQQMASPCATSTGIYVGGLPARGANSSRTTLTGLSGGGGGGSKGSGGREPSNSSLGLFSRAGTQTGHLIVAVKGPGDSLGFAGMLPAGGSGAGAGAGGAASSSFGERDRAAAESSGGAGSCARQPVWSANVCARTQVTAFVASIESLHKLARAHPQVEPLLQQMAVQQETDLAVAEAMRALRLVGGAAAHGAAAAAVAARSAATASASAAAPGGAVEDAPAALNAPASVSVAAAAALHARGAAHGGGGVSSEGESLPQALVSEWHRRSSSTALALGAARGSGGIVASGEAGGGNSSGGGAIGGTLDMVESTEEADGVDDVVMMSGELFCHLGAPITLGRLRRRIGPPMRSLFCWLGQQLLGLREGEAVWGGTETRLITSVATARPVCNGRPTARARVCNVMPGQLRRTVVVAAAVAPPPPPPPPPPSSHRVTT